MRKGIIFSIITAVLITAAGLFIWRGYYAKTPGFKEDAAAAGSNISSAAANQEAQPAVNTVESSSTGSAGLKAGTAAAADTENKDTAADDVILLAELKVNGNSPEYDLRPALCKRSDGSVFVKLEYYYEGESKVQELPADKIPELKYVSAEAGATYDKPGRRVKAVYLDPVYSKVYILAEGNSLQDFIETSIYVFNFKDSSVKRLFSKLGKVGVLSFSKDFKYLAFSWNDAPTSSVFLESSLLELIDCSSDSPVITGSRDSKGALLGGPKDASLIYDYVFLNWTSNKTVKLEETTAAKSDGKKNTRQLLYDIDKNLLANIDGSPLTAAAEEKNEDSGAVKALKSFYTNLEKKESYGKAMELLGSGFKLKLDMMKQFGVEELTKNDIASNMNDENISLYGKILSMTRIESIVREDAKPALSTIYYYQQFSSDGQVQGHMPLAAQLSYKDGKWQIDNIADGNINEAPFKQ